MRTSSILCNAWHTGRFVFCRFLTHLGTVSVSLHYGVGMATRRWCSQECANAWVKRLLGVLCMCGLQRGEVISDFVPFHICLLLLAVAGKGSSTLGLKPRLSVRTELVG